MGSGIIDVTGYEKIGSSGSLNTGINTIISSDQGMGLICISTAIITDCPGYYPNLLLLDGKSIINTIVLTEAKAE